MANDQQFCLRWNNHQSTLISVFDSLLENETLVDCTLAAEGQSLKAHKVVLSACSPYLESLLSKHYEKHPILILKDVKFTELKSMMDYMYRGEVNICQDQLGTFLKAAESLQIKGLSDNGDEAVGTSSAAPKKDPPRPSVTQTTRTPVESKRPAPPGDSSDASRDGSISPSSLRKRRRTRRPSQGDEVNHLDSNCDTAQTAPIVPAVTVPAPVKQIVKQEPNLSINETGLKKEIIEPPNEPLLEPKTEYLDYMNNENSIEVEDLTLDDDDDLDSSMDASRPGPSHGDMSNQGYPAWPMGDQSGTDEIFMAAQEAVGAATGQQQRDSQEEPEKSAANDNPVPILQVINVDTNKPLKIIKIDTTLYKKKLAARKQEALQKTQEKPDEPLKWLQSQFVEVEVCSTETPTCIPEEALSAEEQEEPSNQDDDYMDDNESAECYEGSSAVESDEEEEWEGKSPNIILSLNTKGKRGSFENVIDDMEFDEESQRFICKRCKKTFKVKASVMNHLRNICTKDPRFGCEYCPYKARSGVSLRVHYGRYHNTTKTRVKTNTIPSYRASKHSLPMVKAEKSSALTPKRPKAKGNKEIPSVKVLRKKPEKRRKVKKVQTSEVKKKEESGDIGEKEFGYDKDSKTYTCKTCGERFKSEQAVGVHTNVICRQVSRKGFKCYFCPYTGRNSALLRVHMGKKHGKWPKLDENGVWLY